MKGSSLPPDTFLLLTAVQPIRRGEPRPAAARGERREPGPGRRRVGGAQGRRGAGAARGWVQASSGAGSARARARGEPSGAPDPARSHLLSAFTGLGGAGRAERPRGKGKAFHFPGMDARIRPGDARPSVSGKTQPWNGRGGRRVGLKEGGSQERGRGSELGSGLACKGSRLFLRVSPSFGGKSILKPQRSYWTSRMCQGL